MFQLPGEMDVEDSLSAYLEVMTKNRKMIISIQKKRFHNISMIFMKILFQSF